MSRSASGARIAGDDYQIIVAATAALAALHSPRRLRKFAIEAQRLGPIDDVVAEFEVPPHEYVQCKFAVDAKSPLTSESLRAPSPAGGRSLLRGMFDRWQELGSPRATRILLVTARQLHPDDPFLSLRDARSNRLVPHVIESEARAVVVEREEWLSHLSTDVGTLERFLNDLEISSGRSEKDQREALVARMHAHGLRTDELAVTGLIGAIRDWLKDERPVFDRTGLARAIDGLGIGAVRPGIHVSFGVIATDPLHMTADVARDVTDIFDAASDAMARRAPLEPDAYDTRVRRALDSAWEEVRAGGETRVLVTGAMRLPAWFLAGTRFREVEGFAVACGQPRQLWASDAADGTVETLVERQVELRDDGADLALALSITHPIDDDVQRFVMEHVPSASGLLVLSLPVPSPQAIRDAAHATAIATGIQRQVQRAIALHRADRIHLFAAAPAGLALLTGHRWNRLRPTLVYEDLGAGRGYQHVATVVA